MATKKEVQSLTNQKLMWLIHSKNRAKVQTEMAQLRKGIGQKPGDNPLLWGMLLEDMPKSMYGINGEPSYAQTAIYLALTLFAVHQQGRDISSDRMHQEGYGLGKSLAMLVKDPEIDTKRITRRFNSIATSVCLEWMASPLHGAVRLLKGDGIPLDYVDLAGDLYEFQFSDGRERTRLKWGQDFYKQINENAKNKKGEEK